jgi:thiamine-phosphate pyrophosphorylase
MYYSSEMPDQQTLRVIDANLNRIGESLRLLEDVARLMLNDTALAKQLKAMRHSLAVKELPTKKRLLQARDSRGDIGIDIEVSQQIKERLLPTTIIANSRRAQESLRVIEELAKIPAIDLPPEVFEETRFELYGIEKGLVSKLLRKDKADRISGLYAIIDTQYLNIRGCEDVATQILEGGAGIIQLRDNNMPIREFTNTALKLKKLCAENGALFIVNDRLDIALAANADGLHTGQQDLPLEYSRHLLPIDKIIGCSVTSVKQAREAEAAGADYLAVSAIFPTQTKKDAVIVGLKALKEIGRQTKLPLVAIGGINTDNIAEVLAAGADSVAVISAIMQAESPSEATRQIIDKLEMYNGKGNES